MSLAQRKFSPAFKRAVFAAFLAGTASVALAHGTNADAAAAYDRAVNFIEVRDYRSARVELMNATAEDPQWGYGFVKQAEVALELFDAVIDDVVVFEVIIICIDRSELDAAYAVAFPLCRAGVSTLGSTRVPFLSRFSSVLVVDIPIGFIVASKALVVNFPSACHEVAVGFEVHIESIDLTRFLIAPVNAIIVDTGCGASHS